MVVLTRRTGEEIVIDGDIRIVVIGIRGGRIRLGVTAPPTVRVDRGEIGGRALEVCSGSSDDKSAGS